MKFQLKDISTYRSPIMGLAIIWVVLYHYQIEGILAYPLGNGFTGVDLFMLCSGLGLYYSYDKNPNTFQFYRRRLFRIFPTYFAVGLIAELIKGGFTLPSYLWKYTTLGYWTDGSYDNWFIPAIVSIYFIYPFLHSTLFKEGKLEKRLVGLITAIIAFFVFYTAFIDTSLMDTNHFLFLYRIPVFLLGMVTAYWIKQGHGPKTFVLIAFMLLPFFFIHFLREWMPVNDLHLKYLSTTFTAPLLMLALCLLFKCVRITKVSIMGGVGMASLEIYLLHTLTPLLFKRFGIVVVNHNITMYIACIVTIIVGILLHWAINMVMKSKQSVSRYDRCLKK